MTKGETKCIVLQSMTRDKEMAERGNTVFVLKFQYLYVWVLADFCICCQYIP